jgi:hypothetical protein
MRLAAAAASSYTRSNENISNGGNEISDFKERNEE